MNSKLWFHRAPAVITAILAGSSLLGAADTDEIANLKAALAAQQQQIQTLQDSISRLSAGQAARAAVAPAPPASLGAVASLTPVIPAPAPAALPAIPGPKPQAASGSNGNPCEAPPDSNAVPPYLRVGSVCIAPVGFLDVTGVWRNENAASGIGSNFAAIPYNNGANDHLSEFRTSVQNSRLGFRADGNWKGMHFIAYNEDDFLGTSGGNNLGVTNGAIVPRIRLFWIDVRKGQWEFLAGQSWSLLTPNRTGLSPLPGDIFYSQVFDVNYLTGLTWDRQPGFRIVYHASKQMALGLALEQPDQYIGGSSGSSATAVTLPAAAALSGIGGSQVDNGSNYINTPNVMPDIVVKLAMDPTNRLHAEVAGVARTFKIFDSATNASNTKEGAGVSFNFNAAIVPTFRIISNNYWSDGGGRYLFGQAPDFIVRANGNISPVHAGGFNEGFEWRAVPKTLLYAYWGDTYIGRDVALDANGTTLIGYGFKGSSNADNRNIQEFTFGFNQTIWGNARYGSVNFMGQYEYAMRAPWYYAAGQAGGKGAKDDTIYFDLRYTLPGQSPNFN